MIEPDYCLDAWLWPYAAERVLWLFAQQSRPAAPVWPINWPSGPTKDALNAPLPAEVLATLKAMMATTVGRAGPDSRFVLVSPLPWGSIPTGKDEDPVTAGERALSDNSALIARGFIKAHQGDAINAWHYCAAGAALLAKGIKDIDKREELAVALRRECCRIKASEDMSLDELNEAVVVALERISDAPRGDARKKAKADPLFWWATPRFEHGVPMRELRFARALASELYERNRKFRPAVPAALSSFLARSAVESIEREEHGLAHISEDGARSACTAIKAAESVLARESAPDGLVPVASYLATVAYTQHREGMVEADSRRVAIPTGRDALRAFGIESREGLKAVLDWLRGVSISGPDAFWPCVVGYDLDAKPRPGKMGGRPSALPMMVEIGYPLAPFAIAGLRKSYKSAGLRLPHELEIYSPVLPPGMHSRFVGYVATHSRQLDAFCMSLPLALMLRREEYADRGIPFDDDLRKMLRREGIHSAAKSSLFENLRESWLEAPVPRLRGILPERTGPVLVPFDVNEPIGPGTRFRFGPDFADADSMIVDMAGLSERKRQEQQASVKARRIKAEKRARKP